MGCFMNIQKNWRGNDENTHRQIHPSEWRKKNNRSDSVQRIPCGKGC